MVQYNIPYLSASINASLPFGPFYNMINKNQWSLSSFSQRDINLRILATAQQPHTEQSFNRLLSLKETHERQGLLPRADILLRVLNIRTKKKEEDGSNLCCSCYEELQSNKYWCRACGGHTCKKCLVRQRELKDETRALFCEKCDQQYLQAMSGIAFYNKVQELQRALGRLVKEQEAIEQLVEKQKGKLMRDGDGRSSLTGEMVSRGGQVSSLSEENRTLKTQCLQLQKKLQFGRGINKDLKKKLHALRKRQKESFGTIGSNNDEYHPEIDPPKLQLDMSIQNLRDSVITSVEERQQLGFMEKCKCLIY